MREDPKEVKLRRKYHAEQLKEWPYWVVGVRLFAAFVQQTSYVPDEYYQAADVVHTVRVETDKILFFLQ